MTVWPDGAVDRSFLESWGCFAGVDEVGRGALAGPVAVGVVVVDRSCGSPPEGVADSKALRADVRRSLVRPIRNWATASAVGWASPDEISALGLTAAQRQAALRAFSLIMTSLGRRRRERVGGVLLDGRHDYLSAGPPSLLDGLDYGSDEPHDPWTNGGPNVPVATMVKADQRSHAVAAASILAKVARDEYMAAVADPGYGWATNRGYGSRAHLRALRDLGPSPRHRVGWRLPV